MIDSKVRLVSIPMTRSIQFLCNLSHLIYSTVLYYILHLSLQALDQVGTDLHDLLHRIDIVEQRVKEEVKHVDGPVGTADLRGYQKQLLLKLRAIRDTMQKDESCLDQLRKERDDARRERDALQTQVVKLTYRVHHLKQHVRP
uniref:Uncharacterized protein n=1 Tax=Hyaloperonospora arabidopsidis (strain Emoy2) TaxID=559515 RepID=M4C511_HYAAE